jgi:hypothetical protein
MYVLFIIFARELWLENYNQLTIILESPLKVSTSFRS